MNVLDIQPCTEWRTLRQHPVLRGVWYMLIVGEACIYNSGHHSANSTVLFSSHSLCADTCHHTMIYTCDYCVVLLNRLFYDLCTNWWETEGRGRGSGHTDNTHMRPSRDFFGYSAARMLSHLVIWCSMIVVQLWSIDGSHRVLFALML